MENFREFQATDPFGRTWAAQFKYLQTGISIRHSDSVDVCYILQSTGPEGEAERIQKVVVLMHPDLRDFQGRTGRKISDPWCSRLAVLKLKHCIESAEDLDKDYIIVTPAEIAEYDGEIANWEKEWLKEHAA